jgi:hypothetical protein
MKQEAKEEIYEAMVVPKGAKIRVPEGMEIGFDVKGDLILQESQTGFNEMNSQYGSILIDENVEVISRRINASKIVRVKGTLHTGSINAESIKLEEGTVRSSSIKAQSVEFKGGRLESGYIEAKELTIDGANVEIGSINADKLVLKNDVKGTIMISNVKERQIDDSAQLKGGFESDIELLGYLAKYRREILSEKALSEVERKLHIKDEYRFLSSPPPPPAPSSPPRIKEAIKVEETSGAEIEIPPEADEAFAKFEENAPKKKEISTQSLDVPTQSFDVFSIRYPKLDDARKILMMEYPDEGNIPPIIKVILNALDKEELASLRAIFSKWEKVIKKAKESFGAKTAEALELIDDSISE